MTPITRPFGVPTLPVRLSINERQHLRELRQLTRNLTRVDYAIAIRQISYASYASKSWHPIYFLQGVHSNATSQCGSGQSSSIKGPGKLKNSNPPVWCCPDIKKIARKIGDSWVFLLVSCLFWPLLVGDKVLGKLNELENPFAS